MRLIFLFIPLLAATPALAGQPLPPPPVSPPMYGAPPMHGAPMAAPILPPVLTDPAMADQIGRVAGAVSRSLLDVPVGEVEAAIEGRIPNRADRRRTMRDSIGDPYIDQRIEQQAAASGRMIQSAGQALAASLPAIMQAIDGARHEIERAVGNFPNPTYPRR